MLKNRIIAYGVLSFASFLLLLGYLSYSPPNPESLLSITIALFLIYLLSVMVVELFITLLDVKTFSKTQHVLVIGSIPVIVLLFISFNQGSVVDTLLVIFATITLLWYLFQKK